MRRQLRHGPQQHGLVLPSGEFRRIEQGDVPLRKTQPVPHGLPRLPRRPEAAEVHAHARDLPGVHGQHQIGLRRRQQLRLCQQQLFGRRRLVCEQIPVHHVDDPGPVMHAPCRPAGEERRQRRVGDDQIVVLPLHHAPQQLCRPEIGGRGHLLLQRQHRGHVGKGDIPHGAAAGHMHLPAQLPEPPEVGQVEIHDMGKCGRRDQHGWHRRSSFAVKMPQSAPACCLGTPPHRC